MMELPYSMFGINEAIILLLIGRLCPLTSAICKKSVNGEPYPLTIATLCRSTTDFSLARVVQQNFLRSNELANCFHTPHYINLYVNDTLHLEKRGWTEVRNGIEYALRYNGALFGEPPNVIIGPFYTNLAMVLDVMEIPYMVTDSKGFDWIDMSRVKDTTKWRTMIEITPPIRAQNQAVVDLFVSRDWMNAILILPESASDNQECQDLADQMLSSEVSLIQFPLNPEAEDALETLGDVMRNAKMFRQDQILVCSPRDARDKLVEKVLIKARDYGLLKNDEISFVFVDPTSALIPFAGANKMFRLGLITATCELLAFRYIMPREDGHAKNESEAAASDAALLTSYALVKYIANQNKIRRRFSHKRFVHVLKSSELPSGRTGSLKFDENGHRRDFILHLYNHGGESMYTKLGEWIPGAPTLEGRLNITNGKRKDDVSQMGIFPDLVKIVVVEEQPFVMRKKGREGLPGRTVDMYEGFTIDLIKELAHSLSFDYDIYLSPENAYGSLKPDRSWDGMVGELLNGNATLACGAISISSTRESVIDFSLGVLSTGLNILVKKPEESLTIFQFMKPFSLELWMAILGASTTVALVYYGMDYCSETRRFTLKETVWFAVGTLLKRGTDFAPVPVSQRILTIGLTFFVMITVSTYTANMAAFLTIKNFGETIDSFESLADATTMGVTTVNHSATATFFQKGTKSMYTRIWSKMKLQGLVPEASRGVEIAELGTTAFIFDYLINEAAQNTNCKVMTVGSPILLQEHGIGMRPGASFKSNINIALLRLKERGYIAKLTKRWWDDKRRCDRGGDSTRTAQVQFGLIHTAGVFMISVFGVCVSALLFTSKKIYVGLLGAWRQRKERRSKEREQQHGHTNNVTVENREKQRLFVGEKRGEAV